MLPSLYILADQYQLAANELANLDLPAEVVADTLESLSGELEEKAVNISMFIRNLEATAEQIKQAEAQMAARRKAIESRADHIRDYLLTNMVRTGITKIECPYFKLAVRDNPPSVVIDDAGQIPGELYIYPEAPEPYPSKKAIAEAIKAGEEVPGAHITRTQRLEIK